MEKFRHRYIVVEGPIGAGKTSLARLLAERSGADLLLEDPQKQSVSGALLPGSPAMGAGHAIVLPVPARQPTVGLEATRPVRRDHGGRFPVRKDPMFARLNLTDDEFALYQRIYGHLAPQAAVPDLVIYFQAPVETLMARVRRRAASYETRHQRGLPGPAEPGLRALFSEYNAAPLLILNSKNLNFVDRPGDFDLLLRRISEMRGPREFFNLGV